MTESVFISRLTESRCPRRVRSAQSRAPGDPRRAVFSRAGGGAHARIVRDHGALAHGPRAAEAAGRGLPKLQPKGRRPDRHHLHGGSARFAVNGLGFNGAAIGRIDGLPRRKRASQRLAVTCCLIFILLLLYSLVLRGSHARRRSPHADTPGAVSEPRRLDAHLHPQKHLYVQAPKNNSIFDVNRWNSLKIDIDTSHRLLLDANLNRVCRCQPKVLSQARYHEAIVTHAAVANL